MTKPEDIPQDVWTAATAEAHLFADWLSAGNSTGSLSDHATEGLVDSFARAILAERERCAAAAEGIRREVFAAHQHERAFVAECIVTAIRAGGPA